MRGNKHNKVKKEMSEIEYLTSRCRSSFQKQFSHLSKIFPDTFCMMTSWNLIIIYSLHFKHTYRSVWKTFQIIFILVNLAFEPFYKSTAVVLYPIFQKEIQQKDLSSIRHHSPI